MKHLLQNFFFSRSVLEGEKFNRSGSWWMDGGQPLELSPDLGLGQPDAGEVWMTEEAAAVAVAVEAGAVATRPVPWHPDVGEGRKKASVGRPTRTGGPCSG